jgi:DHA1 family tetracycline resistance protein-like MFS transporter
LPLQRNSPLIPIFLIVVVDVLGLAIILPLLPFYAEKLGASPTTVGLLVSTYAVCQLIAGPMLGRMSDRMGRKPLLLVSQAGTFAGFILLAYSQTLWLVFLARIIDGLTAGNLSLAQAYISDVTKPEERTKAFGLIGIAFGIGFLIGPALAGLLAQYSYQYPIFAAAALSATSIFTTWRLLPSVNTASPDAAANRKLSLLDWGNYVTYFRQPGLSQLLRQFAVYIFGFSAFMSGFALFAERRYTWAGQPFGPKQVGLVYAYVGFLAIILQGGLLGRLSKRFGDEKLVRAGFVFMMIGFAGLGFSYNVPTLLLASTFCSFGTGALRPALTSLITQHASRSQQGAVLGLTQSLMSVAQIVAPFIAGLLIDHGMLTSWAMIGVIVSIIGLSIRTTSVRNFNATPTPTS